MATYILMTKLGPEELQDPAHRRKAGLVWKRKVEKYCPDVNWLAHYALLGPYDFMSIYEAEDEAAAFRVSLISRQRGALTAESWPAVPYEKFLPMYEELIDEET